MIGWLALAAAELALGRDLLGQVSLAGAGVELGLAAALGGLQGWLPQGERWWLRGQGPTTPAAIYLVLGGFGMLIGPQRPLAAAGLLALAWALHEAGCWLERGRPKLGAPLAVLVAPLAVLGVLAQQVWYGRQGSDVATLTAVGEHAVWLLVLVPAVALAAWRPVAALPALGCTVLLGWPRAPGPGPSRVTALITVDTWRADAPLDAGLSGWTFADARSTSGWTLPSLASVHTGLTPWDHGAHRVGDPWLHIGGISPNATTLAERFQDAGWTSVAVVTNPYCGATFGLSRGFDRYTNLSTVVPVQPLGLRAFGRHGDLSPWQPHDSGAQVAQAVRQTLAQTEGDVFLWVHILEPHLPYGDHDADVTKLRRQEPRLSGSFQEGLRAAYQSDVDAAQMAVREVLHALPQQDRVVALTSDHGEAFWEHGGVEHGHALWGVLTHVPLQIEAPGLPDLVRDDPVSGVDLGTTLLSLSGVDASLGDGHDLSAPVRADRVRYLQSTLYGSEQSAVLQGDRMLLAVEHAGLGLFSVPGEAALPCCPAGLVRALPDGPMSVQETVGLPVGLEQLGYLDATPR
jgi:hypothetical protein